MLAALQCLQQWPPQHYWHAHSQGVPEAPRMASSSRVLVLSDWPSWYHSHLYGGRGDLGACMTDSVTDWHVRRTGPLFCRPARRVYGPALAAQHAHWLFSGTNSSCWPLTPTASTASRLLPSVQACQYGPLPARGLLRKGRHTGEVAQLTYRNALGTAHKQLASCDAQVDVPFNQAATLHQAPHHREGGQLSAWSTRDLPALAACTAWWRGAS